MAGIKHSDTTRASNLLKQWLLRYLSLVLETGADSTCFQAGSCSAAAQRCQGGQVHIEIVAFFQLPRSRRQPSLPRWEVVFDGSHIGGEKTDLMYCFVRPPPTQQLSSKKQVAKFQIFRISRPRPPQMPDKAIGFYLPIQAPARPGSLCAIWSTCGCCDRRRLSTSRRSPVTAAATSQ